MSPSRMRRSTRSPHRKAELTASLVSLCVVVAALALFSRFLPSRLAPFPQDTLFIPHLRSLASLHVLAHDFGETARRMLYATGLGALSGGALALVAAKSGLLHGPVRILLGGLRMMPLLCLLPFLHLLGFESATCGVTALCLIAPIASAALESWERIPRALDETARALGLTGWQRFWRLEAPFAIPECVTALAETMPLAWCILIAAEMIPVNGAFPTRPGLGTHAAHASALGALWQTALLTLLMGVLAVVYDRCLVYPWQIWADRYRLKPVFDDDAAPLILKCWRRTRFLQHTAECVRRFLAWLGSMRLGSTCSHPVLTASQRLSPVVIFFSVGSLLLAITGFFDRQHALDLNDVATVCEQSLLSTARMALALLCAALLWIPLGVWLGLTAQRAAIARIVTRILTLYPKNILFPVLILGLLYAGTPRLICPLVLSFISLQWVLLTHILRGMNALPVDLLQAAQNLHLRGRLWWMKVILPGLAPALIEGASAAAMTGWMLLILAEHPSWQLHNADGAGIGAFVARAIESGDLPRVVLGTAGLTLCIALGELLVWRPIRFQIARRIPSSEF